MFKVGDRVVCIQAYSWDNIEINKTYTISEVYVSDKNHKCLILKETGGKYFQTQFLSNIKEIRKEKLNKICLNQEKN